MDFDGDVELLLMFGREVNSSVKMRDIEFEVRRLLKSPDDMPPGFQHPQPFHLAQEHDTIDQADAGGGGEKIVQKAVLNCNDCFLLYGVMSI